MGSDSIDASYGGSSEPDDTRPSSASQQRDQETPRGRRQEQRSASEPICDATGLHVLRDLARKKEPRAFGPNRLPDRFRMRAIEPAMRPATRRGAPVMADGAPARDHDGNLLRGSAAILGGYDSGGLRRSVRRR